MSREFVSLLTVHNFLLITTNIVFIVAIVNLGNFERKIKVDRSMSFENVLHLNRMTFEFLSESEASLETMVTLGHPNLGFLSLILLFFVYWSWAFLKIGNQRIEFNWDYEYGNKIYIKWFFINLWFPIFKKKNAISASEKKTKKRIFLIWSCLNNVFSTAK